MKKKLQSFILILVMLLELMPSVSLVSAAEPSSGWNPDGGSYVISTVADLDAFRSAIAGGNNFGGKTITLANDIAVGETVLTPIKTASNKPEFDGVLDGQGHKITGFNDISGGLVYTIGNWDGKNGVRNLELNVNIPDNKIAVDQDYYAVAQNVGAVIENCKVGGSITRTDAATGTVTSGFTKYLTMSSCSISNCISAIAVNAGNGTACGITTDTDSGSFSNCLSLGALTGATVVPITGSSNTTDSYYKTEASSLNLSGKSKGTGKTDSELKQVDTFANWDTNYTWKLAEGSYPELKVFSTVTSADIELFNQTIATGETEVARNTYYTPASITAIQTALNAAKAVNPATASMADLQGAGKNLQIALANAIVIPDKSGLQNVITQAGTYISNKANYTAYSIGDLSEYVGYATDALNEPETDKDNVDYWASAIQEKITALVSIADLNTALTNSDTYKAADYTTDSYAKLTAAITAAEAVLTSSADSNTEVTKDQVATAVQGITAAIAGLVKINQTEPTNTWDPTKDSYVISTAADLDAFRVALAGGNEFGGKTITLANDINIGEYKLTALDKYSTNFYGSFDGQGHKIIGFNDPVYGLFKYTSGDLKNLELNVVIPDGKIAATDDYYALVQLCRNLDNCKVSGSIVRTDAAETTTTAGFGYSMSVSGQITNNCISAIDITAPNGTVCGIFSQKNTNKMIDCLCIGTLTGKTVLPLAGQKKSVDCFYNAEGVKGELSTYARGTGKTASELKQSATFTNWDGNYTWVLNDGNYPELKVFGTLSEADKTLFKQTIAAGETEVKRTDYYTPGSITAIQTALDVAKAVALDKVTLQTLLDAGRNLQASLKNAIVIPDKTALKNIIDLAGTYIGDTSKYTAYSLGQLNTYVGYAKDNALNNVEASQTTVDAYLKYVQERIDALVPIVDLDTALTKADACNAADYTADSFAKLTAAVSAAENLQNSASNSSNNITKEQVATAVQGINDAIAGLVKATPVEPTNTWDLSKESYVISTVADLDAFRSAIAGGNNFGGKTITVANDIVIGNTTLTPIKTATNKPSDFCGVLDGQGHKITGFNDASGGLVYSISNWDGKNGVRNLELNVNIPDKAIAADQDYYAVAKNSGAVIENCKVSGSITRTDAAADTVTSGFINYMNMSTCFIRNCISAIDINAGSGTACGIATEVDNGNFVNCLSLGTLTGATVVPITGSSNTTDSYYNSEAIKGTLSDKSKGTAKTDSELKQVNTFANWDGNYTWKLTDGSYPELKVFSAVTQADIDLFNQTVSTGETEAVKTTYYTPASITAMQSALTAAKAVNPATASMLTLQTAGKNLQTAIKSAIVIPDKSALQIMIDKAGTYNSANYTVYSFKYLTSAINSAKSLMINAEASQTSVDKSSTTIQSKIDALVSIVDLTAALTNSDAYQAADYTADSYAKLTAAITAAEAVSTNTQNKYENVTSDEISAVVKGINDAIAGLVKVNPGVEKSALQKAVTDAEAAGYLEANYSSEAWKSYNDCLSAAKTVLAKTDATQSEVDTAKANLENAISTTLVNGALAADKTALKAQLDLAATLVESQYTPESYAAVTTAKTAAQTCYDNNKLSKKDQTEVDAKTADLKTAIAALVKANVNTPPTLSKNEAGQYTVSNVADLNALRSDLQSGYTYKGETVIMTGDIDATGLKPYQTPLTQCYVFDGTFDGRGHTIANYTDSHSGLFSIIGANGVVGDFIIQVSLTYDGTTGIDYKALNSTNIAIPAGIVADGNGGKVTRCGVTGTIAITGADSAGSLVGEQNSHVRSKTGDDALALKGTVTNCYSRAAVSSSSAQAVKYYGVSEDGTVENSYYAGIWSGAISGDSQPIGGGTITNCFYDSGILGVSLNDAKGTANATRMMKKETTYTNAGWDFTQSWSVDSSVNDSYPKLDFAKKATLNKREVISLKFVLEPRTFTNAADFETSRMTKLKEVQIVNDIGTNPYHLKVDYSVKDVPFYVGTMGDDARGYVTFNSLKLTYDANNEVDYELDPEVLTGGQRNVARGQFLENSTADPTADQQKQIIANSKAACNLIIKKWLGETPDPTQNYDPWIILSAARNDYPVPDGFYDEYFKTLCKKYADLKAQGVEGKTFDACDTAKDALLIEAIGYDPRNVGGYDLIDILSRKDTATNGKYFAGQYSTFAITAQDFAITKDSEHNDVNAYIHSLAQVKTTDVQGNTIQNDTASDMAVMGIQPIMAYYNPNAQLGDEWYDVKVAVEYYLKMFENAQCFKGTFWGGFGGAEYTGSKDFDLANYWTNAQVNLSLGMAGISPFDSRFVKNGKSPLDGILTAFDLEKGTYDSYIDSYDPTQITRGINALIRSAEGKNQFFDMRDVTNSTVPVNNAITALPDTITADNKAAVQNAADLYDALNTSKKATISTANTAKLTAAKTAAGISEAGAAAKAVMAQITALPEAAAIKLDNQQAVTDARNAYDKLSKEDQIAVTNYKKLTDCEATIAELQKSADADSKAAQGVTKQINALGTITSYDQKGVVEAARSAYNGLTVAQKALISNDTLTLLKNAEAAIEKLKPTTGSITIDVERFTIGQGFYVEPVTMGIKDGETARQAIEELLGTENLIGDVGYLRAVKGADAGSACIPDYIVDKLGGDNSSLANAYASRYGGDVLGEFDYSKYSGWYYLVNNKAPNVGMNGYTLKNGDVMRLAFTYWGYGSDLTGLEFGTNKTLVPIANKDSLLKAIAKVNENDAYLSDAAISEAYDNAMTVVQDMTASSKATKDAASDLNKAIADYKPGNPADDTKIAKAVTDQIAALPAVAKLVLTDKAVVEAARSAYEALTDKQKALVTNLSTLTAAETKLTEIQAAVDQNAAKAVTDQIAALPAVDKLAITDKTMVTAARTAYEALTADQKKLVTNLNTLTAAEEKIAKLVASEATEVDKAAAKTVSDQIAGLPAAEKLTLGSKADVVAVRVAYNGLTDIQKTLITNQVALATAEARIAELEKATPPVQDKATGIEMEGLPADVGIKVNTETNDTDKTGEAQKAAEAAGIKAAKIVSLYSIKPDMSAEALVKFNSDPESFVTLTLPLSSDQQGYESYKIYHKKSDGTVEWITPTLAIDKKSLIFKVNAFSEFGVVANNGDKAAAKTVIDQITALPSAAALVLTDKTAVTAARSAYDALSDAQKILVTNLNHLTAAEAKIAELEKQSPIDNKVVNCSYQTQIENIGWQEVKTNGETSGTYAQSLRLEGIKINLDNAGYDLGVSYQTHVQDLGWQGFRTDGALSGTENQSKRLEAIQIKLTGADADKFDIYYRVHAQNYGWLGWTKNGASAGTEGLSLRLEAIEIKVVVKGADAPGATEQSFVTGNIKCNYQTQIENIGWQDVKRNGDLSGTTGQSLRLEGIKISLDNAGYDVGLSYQTHVQDLGWQDLKTTGVMSGTEGQSKRLEAIRISLTGADAGLCDIYYQVHAQNIGWMGWAKNGESAGTEGLAYRLEGIRIMVVPKGAPAPGSTSTPFVSNK
jgi:hypothetical protein